MNSEESNRCPQMKFRDHTSEILDLDQKKAMELEDSLWWTRGRKHIIYFLMNTACEKKRIRKIMDLGCGTGAC